MGAIFIKLAKFVLWDGALVIGVICAIIVVYILYNRLVELFTSDKCPVHEIFEGFLFNTLLYVTGGLLALGLINKGFGYVKNSIFSSSSNNTDQLPQYYNNTQQPQQQYYNQQQYYS
jgi:uncharacterized membrane protein YqgA involved in biofilm formation